MLWFIVAAVLAGGAYAAYKYGKKANKKLSKKSQKALPKGPRNLLNLQVNDIVSHFMTDYMVEGKLIYSEDGDEWYDYMLVDGDKTVWLSVEDDDRLEVSLFHEIDDLNFTSKPPEFITYQGLKYELEEWGKARVTRVGQTGTKQGMSCKYFEYEAPGGKYMSIEQWGEGSFEVSIGEDIRPNELEILPGDEV